ncbi:MAG TPA: tetratricopeptide repeat protein [Anaeromyxobacteraceae bacterium]|nr:tetratricopeptide repeat protein [Anaeromyxobacteraceae bacterium]
MPGTDRTGSAGTRLAALVLAAAAALYAPTLRHGFAFDDAPEVVQNEHVRSLSNLPAIFTSVAWAGAGEPSPIYRPLTTATYALNHALHGLSPLGYHLGNVLLHAAASALVLALALRLGMGAPAAALAALLFAVHPVHVEVVANVAGRKDALATVFVLLAVLAHGAAARRGGALVLLPPLALAGALLSKESGLAALAILPARDLLLGGEARRPGARRRMAALYASHAAVALLYLFARRAVVGSLGVPLDLIPWAENPLAHAPAGERFLTAVAVLGRGLALQAFPWSLAPDYSFDAIPLVRSPLDPRFLAAAAALLAIAAVAAKTWRSRPLLAFCAAWYAAAIFPASNLAVPVGTTFGERLLYLPSVAFCLLAGEMGARAVAAGRARWVGRAAVAAAVAALSARTVAYAAVWSDEVSLFEAAVRAEPASAKAHDLLGAAYMEVGRPGEGVREIEEAVRILGRAPVPPSDVRVKLGVAYERLGRLQDAEREYVRVLGDAPGHPDALWRLGVVRWGQGRRQEAVDLWERTLAVDPGHARAMSDLGIAAMQGGDEARAEALWTRATEMDPRAAGPWLSLGALYERRGEIDRARSAWEKFLERARYGAYPRERQAIEERLRARSRP